MDIKNMYEKAKLSAGKIAEKTTVVADVATKRATDFATSTKLNIWLFDLNTENEILYKELGKLSYDKHNGIDVSEEDYNLKISLITEKLEEIAEVKAQINDLKSMSVCPVCAKETNTDNSFCPVCGAKL